MNEYSHLFQTFIPTWKLNFASPISLPRSVVHELFRVDNVESNNIINPSHDSTTPTTTTTSYQKGVIQITYT